MRFAAPEEYLALYPDAPSAENNSDAQLIHAMVSALDDLVGNITGKLKSTGLWSSTIMVFTADVRTLGIPKSFVPGSKSTHLFDS